MHVVRAWGHCGRTPRPRSTIHPIDPAGSIAGLPMRRGLISDHPLRVRWIAAPLKAHTRMGLNACRRAREPRTAYGINAACVFIEPAQCPGSSRMNCPPFDIGWRRRERRRHPRGVDAWWRKRVLSCAFVYCVDAHRDDTIRWGRTPSRGGELPTDDHAWQARRIPAQQPRQA